jgi:hypothetical protein
MTKFSRASGVSAFMNEVYYSPEQIKKMAHVIVGLNGMCLCGVYGGESKTCEEIIAQAFRGDPATIQDPLKSALDQAVDVLEWYADRKNHEVAYPDAPIDMDAGDKARTLLEKLKEE